MSNPLPDLGGGATFYIYISPQNDGQQNITDWDVHFQQGGKSWKIESPETELKIPGGSGIFELTVFAGGPHFKSKQILPTQGSNKNIGCNENCFSLVQLVATADGHDAVYVTTWDAACSGLGGE